MYVVMCCGVARLSHWIAQFCLHYLMLQTLPWGGKEQSKNKADKSKSSTTFCSDSSINQRLCMGRGFCKSLWILSNVGEQKNCRDVLTSKTMALL